MGSINHIGRLADILTQSRTIFFNSTTLSFTGVKSECLQKLGGFKISLTGHHPILAQLFELIEQLQVKYTCGIKFRAISLKNNECIVLARNASIANTKKKSGHRSQIISCNLLCKREILRCQKKLWKGQM